MAAVSFFLHPSQGHYVLFLGKTLDVLVKAFKWLLTTNLTKLQIWGNMWWTCSQSRKRSCSYLDLARLKPISINKQLLFLLSQDPQHESSRWKWIRLASYGQQLVQVGLFPLLFFNSYSSSFLWPHTSPWVVRRMMAMIPAQVVEKFSICLDDWLKLKTDFHICYQCWFIYITSIW